MKQFLFLICILFLSSGIFAQGKSENQYLFIIDGSGSMWQKIGNDHKIAVAKTVMKNLVQKLPESARAGLIAYGHTRKNDCEDIETLVPLSPLNKATFQSKLEALNPQGKTPIAKSLNHALALIKSETNPVTIILVSDGLETCDGDACDLIKKAKQQGVKITVHVVGFGISENDLSALECIAQAGEGQYFPANNAEELSDALDQTVEEPVKTGGYLSVKVTQGGRLIDAAVKVYKKGDKKSFVGGRTYEKKETNPRLLLLPEGVYEVEVLPVRMDGDPVQKLSGVQITMNDTLYKELDFAQSDIEVLVTRNGELSDASVQLFKPGTKEIVASGRTYRTPSHNPQKFKVLPGKYDVEIASVEIDGRPVKPMGNQTLEAGKNLSLSHNFASGDLKVGAMQGANFVDAAITVLSKKTGKSVAGGRTYMSASSNPKTFTLEPGEYEVKLNPVKPKGLSPKTMTVKVTEKGTAEVKGEW